MFICGFWDDFTNVFFWATFPEQNAYFALISQINRDRKSLNQNLRIEYGEIDIGPVAQHG